MSKLRGKGMTRKETLRHFKTWCQNNIGNHCSDEDFQMANNIMALLEQEPCEDAISRRAVLDIISKNEEPCDDRDGHYIDNSDIIVWDIKILPSVQPKSKTGHWIKIGDRGLGYSDKVICKCSECEYQKEFTGKFDGQKLIVDIEHVDKHCSNCGTKMVEPQESEEV